MSINEIMSLSTQILAEIDCFCAKMRYSRYNLVSLKLSDEKLYEKLLSLQKSTHVNNQQVLYALFSMKDDLPFKKSLSQEKVGISEFQDKVVILLILKPNLLTEEELLLLYHQMYGYPCKNNLKGSYQIIYVPIPDSSSWSDTEEQNYKFLSNQFPWYSISRPRFLSPAVLNFIKHEWNYRDEPIAVVIDTRGSVTNLKAIHMMKIWGFDAYPFSSSREEELWRTEKSTFQLLLTRIEPLLADRIQEGQNICIYGGDDVRWIREFHRRIEETILGTGLQLILVYVGKRALTSKVRNILLSRTWESLGPNNISLSITSIQFFWICLDSIRRSIPPQMNKSNAGHILQDALGLLELDGSEPGWAMLHDGLSRDALRLQSKELMKCFELFPIWRINMQKWGLVGAMRMALEVPSTAGPCSHSETTLFEEFLLGKIVFCSECRRPLKSYIIYE
ncbi:hypothetical protein SAY87_013836 [Trapa incisa]|uniref:Sieve element occlusion C-terminal domain-containing protein n=1 Tax=Trapa incisa TaxID=236973 RepID=A0AAN7K9A9_9MYRT|nr:hypothetical protein SAY87_013836 [Trapa incisa]